MAGRATRLGTFTLRLFEAARRGFLRGVEFLEDVPIASAVSLPTHATTYQLSREQVSGQHSGSYREEALRCLAAAGVPAAVDTDGVVRGVFTLEPRQFKTLPGAPIAPRQAFEVHMPGTLRFADPSPLSQLGDVPFLEATSLNRLTDKLIRAWSQRVQLIEAAVLTARGLAPNAQLYGDPWRIEGEVSYQNHMIRVMFSTRGDRACVCAVDGCPVDRAPVRRKILPVDAKLNQEFWHSLLADAVDQAKPCLGPPVVSREERQLSIDLASRDLEIRPIVDLPSRVTVSTVVAAPPKVPPPRNPPPRNSPSGPPAAAQVQAAPALGPTDSWPPLPRPHLASNPRSHELVIDDDDVLLSVDLSTDDSP